ncbi:RNA polymerase recycling motor HelD [Sporolactobacillus spathodeae]|uniref:DNA helicase-2/ATP-dependent DNA helicase PcrA n=1 Tax=Sporolactobacillus spathodeae TaxID=1465502 RepID=A0ABS2Q5A3_9BACL|nr:RNA polymerase recycling motor HelD [Sporolactobacillus spathodeae]MBM7656908.1 DNA helicase-2/ATP-dependent DNA helicase PcrA [Sporolactobacillus spathodeae]
MDERTYEQARVAKVLAIIQEKLNGLTESKGQVTKGIVDLRKNFWEDVTVNLDEADDVYETQASIKQQAELLSERERRHGQMTRQVKLLYRLGDSPYFGRIDFQEDGESTHEAIYIGIGSLMDARNENFLIYDWRAPIASMYYDFAPGRAFYQALDGQVSGTIRLKRQFIIRQGQINGMFDTGLTIGDALLQKLLGGKATSQMKSIVATIQREQNQIIRNESDRFLIVQGAAGSGKTSAALQRVAFLLYRNRKTLHSENMLLFSPNPLFSSFISSVLPELGEENVVQATFKDFIEERIGRDLQLENPFDQTEALLTLRDPESYRMRSEGILFKASPAYIRLIDNWLEQLKGEGMIFRNIVFRDQVIVSSREIERRFYARFQEQPIRYRLEEVRDWLLRRVAVFAKKERRKDWVLEEGELLDQADYAEVYEKLQQKKQFSEETFDDYDREEEMLRRIVMNRRIKPLRRRIKQLDFVNTQKIYSEIFYRAQTHERVPQSWRSICQNTRMRFEEGDCPWEDAVPYLYLKEKIKGRKENDTIRHLIIDEAQDYSPVQLVYLRTAFPKSSMTILGDHNQTVYAQSFGQDTMLTETLYPAESVRKLVLLRSYRSTKEIMDFARCLVPEGEQIEPFDRSGKLPELIHVSKDQRLDCLLAKISELKAEGYETIALVGKTMAECRDIYRQLDSRIDVKLMTQATYQFDKGLIVIPTYLAKGIEFDVAIIIDASLANYRHEQERTIFYTACTRAMHRLIMLTNGAATPFLSDIPGERYMRTTVGED